MPPRQCDLTGDAAHKGTQYDGGGVGGVEEAVAMKKKVIRKKQITPKQAKQMKTKADERFSPGVGGRLSSMVAAAMQRQLRVRYLSVNPSSLLPHVPEALERAKAFLVGEPSLRESLLRKIPSDNPSAILAYRNENGDLCSFADYAALAIAQDAMVQKVRVVVLGEGNHWYKMKDSPVHLM